MKIEIYTDGACSGNPGKGGYGILMRVPEKKYQKTFFGLFYFFNLKNTFVTFVVYKK